MFANAGRSYDGGATKNNGACCANAYIGLASSGEFYRSAVMVPPSSRALLIGGSVIFLSRKSHFGSPDRR